MTLKRIFTVVKMNGFQAIQTYNTIKLLQYLIQVTYDIVSGIVDMASSWVTPLQWGVFTFPVAFPSGS